MSVDVSMVQTGCRCVDRCRSSLSSVGKLYRPIRSQFCGRWVRSTSIYIYTLLVLGAEVLRSHGRAA